MLLRISGSVGEKKVQIYRSEDEDQVVLYPFGLAVFAPPSVFLAEVAVEGEEQLPEEENREEMSEALEGREKSADQEEALGAGEIEPEALDRRGGEAGGEAVGVQVEDQNLATLRGTSQAGLLGTRHGSDLPEVRSPEEILAGAVPMGGVAMRPTTTTPAETPTTTLSIQKQLEQINAERERLARERLAREKKNKKRTTSRSSRPAQGPAWLRKNPIVPDKQNGSSDNDGQKRGWGGGSLVSNQESTRSKPAQTQVKPKRKKKK